MIGSQNMVSTEGEKNKRQIQFYVVKYNKTLSRKRESEMH